MTAKTKGSRSASGRRSKKNKGASVRIPVTTLLVLIAFALFAALKKNIPTVGPTGVENVASTELMSVEMPDSVASNQIDYLGYTVSFNPRLHIPNWVAWELTREETMARRRGMTSSVPTLMWPGVPRHMIISTQATIAAIWHRQPI